MAVGGGSAERRAEELAASGDAAAGAWAAGAKGEQRVADELSHLREAWTVLHDRLLRPGQSDANLDHVVVGPGGVFLVDAKNRAGRVAVWDGGLFQYTVQDGERVSLNLAGELKKAHGMARYMSVESGYPVTPVLCLAGANEGEFGEPQVVQGVWVVPVSKLVGWLGSRPHAFERDAVQRAVTRAMTDFPSTTTDPELLAAMGRAAPRAPRARRVPRRSVPPAPHHPTPPFRPNRRPLVVRLFRALVGVAGMMVLLSLFFSLVPPLVTSLFTSVADVGAPHSATRSGISPASTTSPAPPTKARSGQKTAALAPTDCARATAAEVAKVLGRKVHPIAVTTGCAWGTRLDDPATVLVSIRLSADHNSFESQLETSVKQRRVVYGTAYDSTFKPATALWVATGQPLTNAKGTAKALSDTHIVVSTQRLGLTDDEGRRKALAIAAALTN